jgi:RNA polymerase sigma-70 factor (ECF subfamily)
MERIIEKDYRFIWRLLRRLSVASDSVDDAVQQVFLIVAERLDSIRLGSERSFAFGTALRIARTFRRRAAREPSSDVTELSASPLPGPDELSDQKRARELLNRVLDDMPFDLRTVFVLFELEGLTSPEIAELLGVPVGTVASRLRRGREHFRVRVSRLMESGGLPGGGR